MGPHKEVWRIATLQRRRPENICHRAQAQTPGPERWQLENMDKRTGQLEKLEETGESSNDQGKWGDETEAVDELVKRGTVRRFIAMNWRGYPERGGRG